MNIETSSNAATAIFQKSELGNSAKIQKTNQSGKSFKDELNTASGEETKTEVKETEKEDADNDKVTAKHDDKIIITRMIPKTINPKITRTGKIRINKPTKAK